VRCSPCVQEEELEKGDLQYFGGERGPRGMPEGRTITYVSEKEKRLGKAKKGGSKSEIRKLEHITAKLSIGK